MSPKTSIPFKIIIPGLVGFLTLTIKRGIQSALLQTQNFESGISHHEFLGTSTFSNDAESGPKRLVGPIYEAIKGIEDMIFESYNNYFTFMLMMLLVNMIIYGPVLLKALFAQEISQKRRSLSQYSMEEVKHKLKTFLKTIITYSLIYCSFHIMWAFLALIFDNKNLFQGLTQMSMDMPLSPSRILMEEEESFLLDHYDDKKLSLSIGKVMSQLDISAYSVRLSKDEKKAFVIGNFPPTLKILDISDSEYPITLSSFSLMRGKYDRFYKNLVLSQDESKLFISSYEYLQIIDISDVKSPVNIATVRDELFMHKDSEVQDVCKTSLLISADAKSLFVAGYGLQVFDISTITDPKIVTSISSQKRQKRFLPSSAFLSQDGRKLFYSDGTLWIYNIENPKDLKLLNSFNSTNMITSMMLSEDTKTSFVISLDPRNKIVLQKLDTSDIYSIKETQIFQFNNVSSNSPIFMDQAPNNNFLFIGFQELMSQSWHNLLIFDTNEERIPLSDRVLVGGAFSLVFTKDSKKVVLGSQHKFKIVALYLDFPNKNAFSQSSNIIQAFEKDFRPTIFRLSPSNESLLYSLKNDDSRGLFGIHRVSQEQEEENKVINISFYEVQEQTKDMVISQDNRRAFLWTTNTIFIMDISNPKNITLLGQYVEGEKDKESIFLFTLSRDGKTGYMTHILYSQNYLAIIDFSDPTKPTKRSSIDLSENDCHLRPVLSKDELTLFIVSTELFVYNVSDASSPEFLSNLTFQTNRYTIVHPPQVILSPDGKTLFIAENVEAAFGTVHIIDVTDVRFPELRSELHTPSLQYTYSSIDRLCAISPDSRTLYTVKTSSITVIDVSNSNSPRYLGDIKILNNSSGNPIRDIVLSNDGKKVYVYTYQAMFLVSSIQPGYSTFMTQNTLLLGERYNIDLFVIQMNRYMDYNRMDAEYKLTKFSVVEPPSISTNLTIEKTTPSWMNFDLKSQTLNVESRRKSDIGTYRVYVSFSTQLKVDAAFSGIALDKCEDLLTSLISLGYLDNQLFLTDKFGEYKDFLLPHSCMADKKGIYEVLQKYSFGTFNEMKVIQSLSITGKDGKLKINTPSVTSLRVEINLLEQGKFLSRNYASLAPVITQNKSRLIMEGSLKDINLALKEVVVNLGNSTFCDGEIIIDDKLNPVMTESVKNISRYFNHNKPPGLNDEFPLSIQTQINNKPVSTGQFFQIKLDQDTFSDNYTFVENLYYHVVLIQDNNETVLPSWISFSDMTLTGTAPEEIFNREFEFKLIVRNEFQEYKEPFKLHVSISSSFVLKLLIKYSPYVLSIVGLLISANKIYNVIFKGNYKHPKDFYVRVGEEVTSEVIFPISFIQEEIQEAKRIFRVIERKVGSGGKDKLLRYFMIEGKRQVDKIKVLETIKDSLNELSFKEKSKFDLYLGERGGNEEGYHSKLIAQIIINTLTMYQLNSSEERETRSYFKKINNQWPEFVEWDAISSSFKIKNNQKFKEIDEETVLISGDEENSSLSESLVKKSSINLDLLKDSLLGYAFDCQNIDILPVSIEIKVKERIKTNFLKRFLKGDLKDCPFSEKGKIGYGIEYRKKYNTLFFNGVVDSDIRNKTLVLQITNHHQKILKELWIFGRQQERESNIKKKSEIEAKGKEYEVL